MDSSLMNRWVSRHFLELVLFLLKNQKLNRIVSINNQSLKEQLFYIENVNSSTLDLHHRTSASVNALGNTRIKK